MKFSETDLEHIVQNKVSEMRNKLKKSGVDMASERARVVLTSYRGVLLDTLLDNGLITAETVRAFIRREVRGMAKRGEITPAVERVLYDRHGMGAMQLRDLR